ncbi:MAG TPA: hypothetical protein VEG27_05920 [Usitatibacter sp.]|nr:hypothetical protein [Usitatibacter sp.]
MRHTRAPTGENAGAPRARGRGAIRTHLGRKRIGPRVRSPHESTLAGLGLAGEAARHQREAQFDRLLEAFRRLSRNEDEASAAGFDRALDAARDALVSAGELTVEEGERLRESLRRDLLQRDHPAMTFRTGDVTTAGTFACAGCGWMVRTTRTAVLPPCPRCEQTAFRKSP